MSALSPRPSRPPRIAFGATVLARSLLTSGLDGIGQYTRCLMRTLHAGEGCVLQPYVFADAGEAPFPAPLANAIPVGGFRRQALPALAWGRSWPALRQLAGQVDLIHAPDHLVPRVRGLPVVATIHDTIPLSHPEWMAYRFRALKNALWRRSLHWADQVITISAHSAGEITRWCGIPAARIHVVPQGVESRWFEALDAAMLAEARRRHGLPERYLLFVGTIQPRKNLERLITAHARLPAPLRAAVPLVVAGRHGWGCEALLPRLRAARAAGAGPLRWLGHVPDAELHPLLAGATGLVFPSLAEGFGLPVLEAFAAGVPVITSNTTALPEVAGDAALLVDPRDERALADAMTRLLREPALADELVRRGRGRARAWTWERTARLTLEVYQRVR